MPDSFILSACRTPIGKFRSALSSLPAAHPGAVAVRDAVKQARIESGGWHALTNGKGVARSK